MEQMSDELLQQWKHIQLFHILHYYNCRSRSFGTVTRFQPIIHSLFLYNSRQRIADFQVIASTAGSSHRSASFSILTTAHLDKRALVLHFSDLKLSWFMLYVSTIYTCLKHLSLKEPVRCKSSKLFSQVCHKDGVCQRSCLL